MNTQNNGQRRTEQLSRMLESYQERRAYWLKEAEKYPRASLGRREAIAYANAFSCMVEDLQIVIPTKRPARTGD